MMVYFDCLVPACNNAQFPFFPFWTKILKKNIVSLFTPPPLSDCNKSCSPSFLKPTHIVAKICDNCRTKPLKTLCCSGHIKMSVSQAYMAIYEKFIKNYWAVSKGYDAWHTSRILSSVESTKCSTTRLRSCRICKGAFWNGVDFQAHCKCNFKVSVFQNKENGWIKINNASWSTFYWPSWHRHLTF